MMSRILTPRNHRESSATTLRGKSVCAPTGKRKRLRGASLGLLIAVLLLAAFTCPLRAEYRPHPRIYLTPERIDRIRTQHLMANSFEWQRLMKAAARVDMDGVRAQALAYAITGDETWARTATDNLLRVMRKQPELRVSFNNTGWTFHVFAVTFDWLYHSPHFDATLKRQVMEYVNAVPKDGKGKWNWYPQHGYFNGVSKILWGPPLWGLATWGDNPAAQIYIDNGYAERWTYIRNALGYGPDNLAVARGGCMPQGMDYGSGTMANTFRYVEAVYTATGEDLYADAPTLREYLEFFVKAYYYSDDFLRRPEHGHNAHKGGAYLTGAVTALLIAMDHYRDTPEARWAAWWLNNIEGAEQQPGKDYRFGAVFDVIFSDTDIPEEKPFSEPLAYFAAGNGMWICRSDWTAAAPRTFATFRAGNWTWFNQNQWDQGNYCIYSHGEDLLVDGGLYDGGGGLSVINYHNQTVAHNCVTIKDPAQTKGWHFYKWTNAGFENSGGQNRPWRETLAGAVLDGEAKDAGWPAYRGNYLHDMSDIERRAHGERYTYAFADLTNAYANERWRREYATKRLDAVDFRPKVTNVTRHWFYLRATSPGEPEHFVTFDRVSGTDASFQKKSLLHFIGEPVFAAGAVLEVEVPGHIETRRADRFSMELGGAVLHGAVILPAAPLIRKVGGKGYEYWVNGKNYDPFPDRENELGGVWRLEIMPPVAQVDDLFLTVLSPAQRGGAAPAVSSIEGEGSVGAEVGAWALVFADTEIKRGDAVYFIEAPAPKRHLVCDLVPGFTYRVYKDDDSAPFAEVSVGESGIAEFESNGGGEYRVTREGRNALQ